MTSGTSSQQLSQRTWGTRYRWPMNFTLRWTVRRWVPPQDLHALRPLVALARAAIRAAVIVVAMMRMLHVICA